MGTDLIQIVPNAGGKSRQIGGAQRRGLPDHGATDGSVDNITLELHQEVVGGSAAVHPQLLQPDAGIPLHGVQDVAALVGDGFQRGPDNVLAVAAAGQPHDGAAGVHVPVGGAKPGKGRHNVDAAVILQPAGEVLAVRGLLDQVQFIPDPLDDRAADEYAALQGVAGTSVGAGGHGGHQPVLALEKVAAGVHQ